MIGVEASLFGPIVTQQLADRMLYARAAIELTFVLSPINAADDSKQCCRGKGLWLRQLVKISRVVGAVFKTCFRPNQTLHFHFYRRVFRSCLFCIHSLVHINAATVFQFVVLRHWVSRTMYPSTILTSACAHF